MVEVLCNFPKLFMNILDKLRGCECEVGITKHTALIAYTLNMLVVAYAASMCAVSVVKVKLGEKRYDV
jgi:hypothetical protein